MSVDLIVAAIRGRAAKSLDDLRQLKELLVQRIGTTALQDVDEVGVLSGVLVIQCRVNSDADIEDRLMLSEDGFQCVLLLAAADLQFRTIPLDVLLIEGRHRPG